MPESFLHSAALIPAFLAYFAIAVVLCVLFSGIYVLITPQREFALIRANDPAAAIAFGGAFIGFALALGSAISHSVGLMDCVVWGCVALVIQMLTFVCCRFVLPGLPERIVRGEISAGILVASLSIGIGVINAACMSY